MCFHYLRILEALLLGSALSSVTASSTSNCKHNLDVVAVLDGSGSIESSDFAKLKTATIQLARDLNLRPNSQRFGVVVFSNTVTNTIPLSSSFTNLRRRISRIRQPGQGTNTHLGIQSMTRILRTGRTSKKVGIVITDGRSGSEQATKQAAKIAKQAGIKMFSVGVGTNINMAELRSIASSFSNVLLLKNFDALKDRFKSLVRKICIVNGGWSSWSAPSYGSCSKSCGRGTRTVIRRRTCTNPRPSGGGNKCYGSTTNISYQACNLKRCIPIVNGGWSNWSTPSYGSCSKSCGRGTRTVIRRRTCTNPRPSGGGKKCYGSTTNISYQACNLKRCIPIVNGGWSSWSTPSYGSCSKSCGRGTRTVTRRRTCTNPRPSGGGKKCYGSTTDISYQACIAQQCPLDGGWSAWSRPVFGSCTKSCGGGTQSVTKKRTCTKPSPKWGGKNCSGASANISSQTCNTRHCPVEGGWSSWSRPALGSCSKSCGGGTQSVSKKRTCTKPSPKWGGKNCSGASTNISSQTCNTQHCPVDGGWSGWSRPALGSCSKSCGGGTQSVTEKRTCTKPSPRWNGKNCTGTSTNISSQTCNTRHCPVEGGWSSWSRPALGSCSKSCGGGTQSVTKKRTCTKPSPKWGGKNCSGASTNISSQTCNTQHCPVHGGWSSWTTMSRSSCSATCGGGAITVRQNRTCTKPTPQYGGKRCSGSDTNVYTVACNTFKCASANGFAVCDSCHYENGVGYVPHPTDCRFYIQCISWGAAYHIRPCAPGLYWKQDTLSCVRPSDVNCTTTATAAPPLQQDTTPAPSTPVPGSTPTCQMKAVPGKASMYSVYVVGHGPMERPCSPGTVFSTALCRCISGGRQTSPSGKRCQDEVYLPLTADVKDHSKHKLYIKNKGVKVNKKGQAVFAHNAVIHIPRFSNMDFGKTLHISFMLYKVNNTAKDQAIVSNANCNRTGSIYIIRKPSAVEFRVRNRNGVFANVIIPQTKATSRVTLTVHKGAMMGSVNGVYKKTAFKGRIATVHCGLLLGRGTGYDSFTGFLKKFKLSLCKP